MINHILPTTHFKSSEVNSNALIYNLLSYTFGGVLIFLFACNPSIPDNGPPEIRQTKLEDYGDTTDVAPVVSEGISLDLWAPGVLLASPVSIDFDYQGHAYVSETQRRKSSDIDIRNHRDWMTEELALSSMEETEAFHKAKLDPSLSESNGWQEDFNGDSIIDWRDLEVETERVRRVWDSDNDGKADRSNLYAVGFNSMLTGVAAGILHQAGEIFLTVAPDVWRLKDKDGDGDADERTSISHGYGIHIGYAGHDMSGVTMGPDGKIYWSIGDIGVNTVDKEGKRWAYPHEGAVMRSNPDGSDFEVFAHGLRNPQELAFDQYGNLISVDNDGDHAGEHERFVHILEGSDSGWRTYWQFGKYNQAGEEYKIWMDESLHVPHFPGQAAYLLPPIALAPNGPAGLVYNPGTALSSQWKDHFFASYFKGSSTQSRIQAFKLNPKGASFSLEKDTPLIQGINSTGVAIGPDGALYLADWLDTYDKKSVGRIWKIDAENSDLQEQRKEVQSILAEGFSQRSSEQLLAFLTHQDMRIRMEAQFELVNRKETEALYGLAKDGAHQLARIHSIWGIGQLIRTQKANVQGLADLLNDQDKEIVAQVAKVIGECKIQSASDQLLVLLKDDSPRVKLYAAEALGKLQVNEAFDEIIEQLNILEDSDPHLRHGLMYALANLAKSNQLASLKDHPSHFVRISAVVALRWQKSPELSRFLNDQHEWVLDEVARAIHDDESVEAALSALAAALNIAPTNSEFFLRRAINANLRIGDEASANRLAEFSSNTTKPSNMRAEALRSLGAWPTPPVLDRVAGLYREVPAHDKALASKALDNHIDQLIEKGKDEVRIAAAYASGKLNISKVSPQLKTILQSPKEEDELRKYALTSLMEIGSPEMEKLMRLALRDKRSEVRQHAQSLLGELDLPEEEIVDLLSTALANGSMKEQQKAFISLGKIKHAAAEALLIQWMEKLTEGEVAPGAQLDLLVAAEQYGSEALNASLKAYDTSFDEDDPLGSYRVSLYGGNIRQGGRSFYLHPSGQCIRCHMYRGMGGTTGPNLTHIGSVLSREEILAAIIEPSDRIAPGYGVVTLTLNDGETVVGTLLGDSKGELNLQLASGEEARFSHKNILKREQAPSAMPSMRGLITKAELRDLVEFLANQK